MGEGQPWLLVVGPLAVVPPPLGPFVTGASMLLMIWDGRGVKDGVVKKGTVGEEERQRQEQKGRLKDGIR